MKLTLSWLKEHLETDATVAELCRTLTAIGLEVERVEDRGAGLAPFVVGAVVDAGPHPNADKLRVCVVDTGRERVQVVCGAPNARAGIKGVFAAVGTRIPATGTELRQGMIRGVASHGMLCSMREMGLSDEHDGIIELPADAPIGIPFAQVLGLDDPVIEINLTPDRADCAGVRGVARDLAAAGQGRLKPLSPALPPGDYDSPVGVRIADDAVGACPLFIGRYIRGVRNGDSPAWLQDRLRAIGQRPISALVDITNLLTFDLARPLHVFDANRLNGDIEVRFARAGESLAALNGKSYDLADGMTAVCDTGTGTGTGTAGSVLALGGIIGGEATGCTGNTVNVVIECALFDPVRTAATGRRLGLESDARYRFERGVDPGFAFAGMDVATRLVLDLCGGAPSRLVVAGAEPSWQRQLTLRPRRLADLGGLAVPRSEQVRILDALGFSASGGDASEADGADGTDGSDSANGAHGAAAGGEDAPITVAVPSWRADVHGEADLVEEVLRIHGFDHIPVVPLTRPYAITRPALTPVQRRAGLVRRTLAGRGLFEAVTWSFMSSSQAELFGQIPAELRLVNPISADLDVLRPSLLANLAQAIGRNAARGTPDLGLFELGPAYRNGTPAGQDLVAAGVRAGAMIPRHWAERTRGVDACDAKADALAALDAALAPVANLQVTTDAPAWYHPGRSGSLRLGPSVLAWFGELHPDALTRLDVKGPMVAFEVFVNAVPQPRRAAGATAFARPLVKLSAFQPVQRDFAFVVDHTVEAERLLRAARAADKALVHDVTVFDTYTGPGVPEGKKSIALCVTLQPTERTLTDAELEAFSAKLAAGVTKATGGTLR